jgi:hypothetical protein
MAIFKRPSRTPTPTPDYIVGDEVSWLSFGEVHTGEIVAVAGRTAKVFDHAYRNSPKLLSIAYKTLAFSMLTLSRRAREDDKITALTGIYAALRDQADRGDLSMWTFLETEWPKLVSAELRALLNLGPDEKADSAAAGQAMIDG